MQHHQIGAARREGGGQGGGLRCAGARAAAGDGLGAQGEEPEDLEAVWEHLQREQGEEAFQAELEMEMEMEWEAERAGRGAARETEREAGARERDRSRAEQLAAAAAAVRRAEEVVAASQRVVRSEEEQRSGSGRRTERDLKQERQRRRKEEAEVARQQSERAAAQGQEMWMARVRVVLASMTWKSGRRRKRSAARAVVGAERVGGGEAAAARAPSTDARGQSQMPNRDSLILARTADAVWAQLSCSRPVARAQGGFDGAGATAAPKARSAGVLCGEQASGSQEEEDRKR